jgi:hypothetical protein
VSDRTVDEARALAGRDRTAAPSWVTAAAAYVSSLDVLSIALVWACAGAARLAPGVIDDAQISEPVTALLSLPLLVVVPRQLGVVAVRPLLRGWGVRLPVAEEYAVAWLAGVALMVVGLNLLTDVAGLKAEVSTAIVMASATAASLVWAARPASEREDGEGGRVFGPAWLLASVLGLAAVPLAMVRVMQPYPHLVGWGMFNMNYRVLEFVMGDMIPMAPGIHTPVHASLVGTSSLVTGAEPFGIIWAAPLLLFLVYGAGVYVFARRVLGSDLLAAVAVWVALWVFSFQAIQHLHAVGMRSVILAAFPWLLVALEGRLGALPRRPDGLALYLAGPLSAMAAISLTRWFLPSAAQVWAILLIAGVFLVAIRHVREQARGSIGLLTVVGAGLTLLHFIEGPIFFGMGVGFLLLLRWQPVTPAWRGLIAGVFAVTIAFVLAQAAGLIEFGDESAITRFLLGSGRADATDIPFDRKLFFLQHGLTVPLLCILGWSAARNLARPDARQLSALAFLSLATLLFVLPESGMHRVVAPAIPLIGLIMALELRWWAERATTFATERRREVLQAALVVAMIIALTPTLSHSLRSQTGLHSVLAFPYPDASREFSSITTGEYRASQWIADHVPQDWAVVSDPITMFYLQGLTFHPQVAEKRAWVSVSEYTEEDQERLRSLAPLVFNARSVTAALPEIERLTEEHPGWVLVLSQRTVDWLLAPGDLFRRAKPTAQASLEDASGLQSLCNYYGLDPCLSMFLASSQLTNAYASEEVAVLVLAERASEVGAAD